MSDLDDANWWWLTSEKITVAIAECDGIIVRTPPIMKKFKGQPIENLQRWWRKLPGANMRPLVVGDDYPSD